jgi:hypothetical protein
MGGAAVASGGGTSFFGPMGLHGLGREGGYSPWA